MAPVPSQFQKVTRWPIPLFLCGLLALLVRLFYFSELNGTPLFTVLIGDAKQYDTWAQRIAAGEWIGSEVFYQTPLYPYLLAVIFKLAGHELFIARIFQAFLGAVSCVLLGYAGERFFNRRVAVVAALLLAIYPPAIFFDGLLQKSALDLFLMTLILALVAKFQRQRNSIALLFLGIAFAAFTLNRENARVLYPVILIWLFLYFRSERLSRRAGWIAIFTISIAATLLPVAIRNYYVGGEFLISTAQLGPNLYIGNHPGARGSYEPLVPGHGNADFERADAKRLAEQATGRSLSPSEISDYWTRRSWEYIRAQPLDWLRLFGKKLLLVFNAREAVDTESIEAYSEYSYMLRSVIWLSFGIVFSLAGLGIWLTRHHWRDLAIFYAIAIALAFSVAMFYVVARYRYPLTPIVLLFAAAAISSALDTRMTPRREWLTGLIIACGAALFSFVPVRALEDDTFLNVGQELIRMKRPDEATPLLKRAVELAPANPATHYNLALALRETGLKTAAIDELEKAIQLRPSYFEAQAALGLSLKETGSSIAAYEHFREAVRLQPDNAGAHIVFSDLLFELGKDSEAVEQSQQAVNVAPNLFEAQYKLAQAYVRTGRLAEAVQSLQNTLAIAKAEGRNTEAQQIIKSIDACRARMK